MLKRGDTVIVQGNAWVVTYVNSFDLTVHVENLRRTEVRRLPIRDLKRAP